MQKEGVLGGGEWGELTPSALHTAGTETGRSQPALGWRGQMAHEQAQEGAVGGHRGGTRGTAWQVWGTARARAPGSARTQQNPRARAAGDGVQRLRFPEVGRESQAPHHFRPRSSVMRPSPLEESLAPQTTALVAGSLQDTLSLSSVFLCGREGVGGAWPRATPPPRRSVCPEAGRAWGPRAPWLSPPSMLSLVLAWTGGSRGE